ncbi:MAG: DUF6531 domain-containing protein [Chthoniobacteraceae bacterium]
MLNYTPPSSASIATQNFDYTLLGLNNGWISGTSNYSNMDGYGGKGVSDPVDAVTGEFYIDSVDLKLNGPMPLEIRRNYGSLNLADSNFGYGWKLSYVPYLILSTDNSVIYAAETDGSMIAYRQTSDRCYDLESNNLG